MPLMGTLSSTIYGPAHSNPANQENPLGSTITALCYWSQSCSLSVTRAVARVIPGSQTPGPDVRARCFPGPTDSRRHLQPNN